MQQKQNNRGFSLVELLISMALLSIIMLMVVQFMSTTTAANKRVKANLKAQTVAEEFTSNLTDSISQASYIRISPYSSLYTENKGSRTKELATSSEEIISGSGVTGISFDLVPDDYGNHVRPSTETKERKVIVNMDTFQLIGEKNGDVYPLSGDLDDAVAQSTGDDGSDVDISTNDVRSFRSLKKTKADGSTYYLYCKPQYIYIEYNRSKNTTTTDWVIYHFVYSGDECTGVYMARKEGVPLADANRYKSAVEEVYNLGTTDKLDGLLTDGVYDFYISSDAEGNAILLDTLVKVKGYTYNNKTSVALRNSNVLTARPQNSYKQISSEAPTTTENSSTEATPENP